MSFLEEFVEALLAFPMLQRVRELVRKYPKQSAIISVIVLMAYVGIIITAVLTTKQEREKERAKNLPYETQLTNLKQVEGNLKDLLSYVEGQKTRLQKSEDLLNSLKTEKEKLEPLVKAGRDVIRAVFDFQEQMREKGKWTGNVVSFVLGVLSSLTAMLIVMAIKSARLRVRTGHRG
jgi:uncharacterized protein YoxC